MWDRLVATAALPRTDAEADSVAVAAFRRAEAFGSASGHTKEDDRPSWTRPKNDVLAGSQPLDPVDPCCRHRGALPGEHAVARMAVSEATDRAMRVIQCRTYGTVPAARTRENDVTGSCRSLILFAEWTAEHLFVR
jgi:hypothetical protein